MRRNQRQLYAERIDRVVEHIQKRVSDGSAPDLAELADVAAMSPYHFHRVYRIMTGEAVGETVRRVRLAHSVPALAQQRTIAEVAGDSGYATSQAFARAFKATAGASASQLRSEAAAIDTLLEVLQKPRRVEGEPSNSLDIEVVSLDPFRLLAIRNTGDYDELNAGYAKLFELVLQQVEPSDLRGIYGIPHDDPRITPASECRFDCALATGAVGQPLGDLKVVRVSGGEYIRLRRTGSYDALHDSIDLVYAFAIGVLSREVAQEPLLFHYLDDPEEIEDEEELRADIFLPLAAEG